ncbi:MAG: GNAT family N-acetyltransferase [Clostridiales bacterium]|nr:GNAT family N-acetyltransferase [Clostridiales bacterium]
MLFKSERLYYRVWQKDDIPAGVGLWGNEEVMKYIEPVLSESQVALSIERGIEHYNSYAVQLFAMVLKETNEVIGCCGLSVEDFDEKIYEFGIHILSDFHHQSFGYEAGKAVLEFADTIDIKKIIATCHLENVYSKKLLMKLGFVYKGNVWYDDTYRFESYFEMERL